MRELSKRLLGIMLAVIMAVTMSPVQGAAAENEGTGYEGAAKTGTSEDKESTANSSNVTEDDGEKVPSYDINKPVIESFEFAENGQTLTANDTLHFTVSAYDADSEIQSVYIYVSYIGNGTGRSIWLEKSGEGNLYTGTLLCSELKGSQFYVSEVKVEDMYGNYDTWNTWDSETGKSRYTFTLDGNIDGNISVCNFRMQTNLSNEDGKLRPGDTVTYTADVRCENEEISYYYARLEAYANNSWKSAHIDLSYDEDAQTLTGTFTVTDKIYPTTWNLDYVYISTESGKYYHFYPSSIEPEADLKFEVVQEDFDTESPVIGSITVDKNGQFVKAGDVVTITVKVREEHPREYATAYFYPQVTNVSSSEYVSMKYDAEASAYTGSITITEDTYPCEWALTELYIYDENDNRTYLYDFQKDLYNTYPWYFNVKPGNTYREDFKAVTFEFYGHAKQEDGSYQPDSLISTQTIEKVGRRTTLEKLGVSFPQPIEGVNTEWKYGWPGWDDESRGSAIDENTEILFNSTSAMTYALTASYDKVCANVFLTYMTKDSGIKTAVLPQFVDAGVTYRDVLDALELPADADAQEFAGFELAYSDDSMQVEGKSCWIEAEAKYKDCQVAWNARYIGADGKETSKVINQSYLEGTRVSEALAELELPEDMEGMELESWVLLGNTVEEISQPMASMDIVAVYRGKTTVDAVYTYRGEDGELCSGSGMVLIDGENLSEAEIEGAATEVFKEVNHFEGLVLAEWTGTTGVNQPGYKTVEFQALYRNCLLTLKYPDGTSQFVVVDKDTQYTLPTENEKYEDIVWEGYVKGETVTVEEDREFTVQESKIKDETQEEPGGVKLSEEEIAQIKGDIEKAEAGTTITIDMKKATVVPKEVLEAIKGKSVDIVLKMDEYSWTIDGKDVLAEDLKDIDLEVKVDANAIPGGIVSALAEGRSTTQLSLTHNGNFGFRADLTLNLGSENSGGTGNLYYYDSSGKLIFMNSGKIGADGSTSLSFSHASDYVIVIDKAEASDNDKKDDELGEIKDGGLNGGSLKQNDEKEAFNDDGQNSGNLKKADIKIKNNKYDNKKNGIDGIAVIRKKDSHLTTDSGSIKTDSSYRKSPKTGE